MPPGKSNDRSGHRQRLSESGLFWGSREDLPCHRRIPALSVDFWSSPRPLLATPSAPEMKASPVQFLLQITLPQKDGMWLRGVAGAGREGAWQLLILIWHPSTVGPKPHLTSHRPGKILEPLQGLGGSLACLSTPSFGKM